MQLEQSRVGNVLSHCPIFPPTLGSFSTKPIHIFGKLGIISAIGSILLGLTVIYQKLNFKTDMSGNPLLLLTGVLIIAAIQFILMGLLAELLVRTYHESQGRPTYVIKEILERSEGKEEKK